MCFLKSKQYNISIKNNKKDYRVKLNILLLHQYTYILNINGYIPKSSFHSYKNVELLTL